MAPMLDLGASFLASVERNPDALAIVDGQVRLTYRAWYDQACDCRQSRLLLRCGL
jgi:hypothetical protein